MNNLKISVIMSVYKEPLEWIAESVESILKQTFKDFEFIIINDNPKRKELQKFLEKYKKQDKRIVLIENRKNLGLTPSLNKGLKKAKGKYIARMDADDISLPKRFQIQCNFLERNKDIFLCGTGAVRIDEKGKKIRDFYPITNRKKIKKILPNRNCFYHPTILFRNEKRFYRDKFKYSQDYDLYLRLLLRNKKITNISNKLLLYRVNAQSISNSKILKQNLFCEKAKKFYNQSKSKGKDEYKDFNPKEILEIKDKDFEKIKDKTILEQAIFSKFKINDFKKTRKICINYFKSFGYFNKIFIYYLASFLGEKMVNFLRKIVF